jgi:hypothetical protein
MRIKCNNLFFGVLMLASISVCAEPIVGFTQDKTIVRAGDVFTISIVGTDLPLIEGGGVSLNYDPSILNVLNVSVDNNAWEFASTSGKISNLDGRVTDILFSSYSGKSGDVQIATIQIKAVARGRAVLGLSESAANPFASQGRQVPVKFEKIKVTVKRD